MKNVVTISRDDEALFVDHKNGDVLVIPIRSIAYFGKWKQPLFTTNEKRIMAVFLMPPAALACIEWFAVSAVELQNARREIEVVGSIASLLGTGLVVFFALSWIWKMIRGRKFDIALQTSGGDLQTVFTTNNKRFAEEVIDALVVSLQIDRHNSFTINIAKQKIEHGDTYNVRGPAAAVGHNARAQDVDISQNRPAGEQPNPKREP